MPQALRRAYRGRGGVGGSVADSVCSCKEEFRSVCQRLPVKYAREGKQYCVLHFPSVDKDLAEFRGATEKKFEARDFDFRGVYFPGNQRLTSFLQIPRFEFSVNFYEAIFEGDADFSGLPFDRDVTFVFATFEGDADFSNSTFMGRVDFSDVTFRGSTNFSHAIFKGEGRFWRLQTSPPRTVLSFESAEIDKPERFSFHSTHLRPSWFIDVDAQKFDFSDVEWFRLRDGAVLKLAKEIESVKRRGHTPPTNLRKLQKACRRLMDNAEENRDYATANELHYWSMELLRQEGWRRLGLIGTLYWILSGYGERPRQAFLVLVVMWILFAIFYMVWGHEDLQVDLLPGAVQALSGADI